MVSVLALPWKVDGKDAIAISYPEGERQGGKRTNGVIKIGLLNKTETGYTAEWKYSKFVDPSYWYSCLATRGEKIAVLYERDMPLHSCDLAYREFFFEDFDEIVSEEDV
jgi:hypothetical protein